MGYNTLALISSPVATGTSNNITHGLHRSKSTINLGREASLRRCFSENHICYNKSSISASSTKPELKSSKSTGALPFQLSSSILPSSVQSFLFDSETNFPETNNLSLVEERDIDIDNSDEVGAQEEKIQRSNWIEKLLEIRSHWTNRQLVKRTEGDEELEKDEIGSCGDDDDGGCEVSYSSDEDEEKQESEVNYDRETFSRLLDQVSPQETRLFSQLAFLCNIAYVIPTIKPEELWDIFRLKFVTSSIDKKAEAEAIKEKFELDSSRIPVAASTESTISHHRRVINSDETCSPSVAYDIAVSAATYVQQHTKDLQSLDLEAQEEGYGDGEQIQEEERNPHRRYKSDVSAYDMATSTMIAVVAAGEKEKQEAAQDLQSPHSTPCEWFICDDLNVRYFVIQGSDSSASWQANLLFEPTEFEGTDGIVHRGIYEAAKGIYEQFLPEVLSHLEKYGPDSKFQFTGHSLGGSLALLVTLMLLKRGVLKPSNLQPVVSFGSPFIFCGGHKILNQLGVDDNLIRSVIMHRDIVPRAFACSYPNQISMLLKRLNGSFRSHPCLIRKKLLYSPVGKVFILQPDEKTSPSHPLLPAGNALYELDKNRCGYSTAALRSFLNRPHPIVTLSNPRAYGSDGTILRDHDSSNYLKAVNGVLRQQMKLFGVGRITTRKQENELWPLLTSPSLHSWSHRSNLSSVNKEVLTGV